MTSLLMSFVIFMSHDMSAKSMAILGDSCKSAKVEMIQGIECILPKDLVTGEILYACEFINGAPNLPGVVGEVVNINYEEFSGNGCFSTCQQGRQVTVGCILPPSDSCRKATVEMVQGVECVLPKDLSTGQILYPCEYIFGSTQLPNIVGQMSDITYEPYSGGLQCFSICQQGIVVSVGCTDKKDFGDILCKPCVQDFVKTYESCGNVTFQVDESKGVIYVPFACSGGVSLFVLVYFDYINCKYYGSDCPDCVFENLLTGNISDINCGPTIPTFTDVTPPSWSGLEACGVQIGDVDNNGYMDIFIGDYIIYNSNGLLGVPIKKFSNGRYSDGVLNDLNRDGFIDKITTDSMYISSASGFEIINTGLSYPLYQIKDIDNDGEKEVFTDNIQNGRCLGYFPGECYVYSFDSNYRLNCIYMDDNPNDEVYGVSDIFDFDNDNELDIFIGTGVYKFNIDKFGQKHEFNILPSINIRTIDLDNNGKCEIVAGIFSNMFNVIDSILMLFDNNTKIKTTFDSPYNFSFGDLNNDGYLDILTQDILYNLPDKKTTVKSHVDGINLISYDILPIDYDNDGDLDLFFHGYDSGPGGQLKLYRNNSTIKNTKPNSPNTLNATVTQSDKRVDFTWKNGGDDLTDFPTYNLFVQNLDSKKVIYFPHADSTSGTLTLLEKGNCEYNTGWFLRDLAPGRYRWKVQAVDQGYTGSAWAIGQDFVIDNQSPTDNISLKSDIDIYPNPTFDKINLTSNLLIESVSINKPNGIREKQITNVSDSLIQIDISDLPSGIYFVIIQLANGNQVVRKFLKL